MAERKATAATMPEISACQSGVLYARNGAAYVQPASPQVWGRPVGLITSPDGSLLIAEAGQGVVWRVSYQGN